MELLQALCEVFAPSGDERALRDFILRYVEENQTRWQQQPKVIAGEALQDCIILQFGQPRTALIAHMDSVGFSVRYQNQLIPIGSPRAKAGSRLVGTDALGPIACTLEVHEDEKDKKQLSYQFGRGITRGTSLVFAPDFRRSDEFVQTSYLDDRLGVYSALRVAETLQDGLLVFSCGEEQGGGTVPYLARFIYEQYAVTQYVVSDVTWVTEGVTHGEGVAISMRDRNIPRRSFLNKIIKLADESEIPYQLEVEGTGSSDARELQQSAYPIDWCFVGAPVAEAHSPDEKVHRRDIDSMIALHRHLLDHL